MNQFNLTCHHCHAGITVSTNISNAAAIALGFMDRHSNCGLPLDHH